MSNRKKLYPKGKANTIRYQNGLIDRAKVQNAQLVNDLIRVSKALFKCDPLNELFDIDKDADDRLPLDFIMLLRDNAI